MGDRVFVNIKELCGIVHPDSPLRGGALAAMPSITNAYLLVEGDTIAAFGSMDDLPSQKALPADRIDASGKMVFPCWCDSHTHLVFPRSREDEFVDKIKGVRYEEIAAKGGGILQTARALESTTEEELFQTAAARLHLMAKMGTGSVEIKSGYGLTVEGELKMLRVIRRLRQTSPLSIRSTFLGAHAFPSAYSQDKEGYVRLVIEEMLPAVAAAQLADYIDVFCEQDFFTPEQTRQIGEAGKRFGLQSKLHANQLHVSGGVQTGVALGALSVDHLEQMDAACISQLAQSATIGTLLPGAAFFLRLPYPPAREMIQANCAIALASDYNPGSSPSGNMNLVVAMACIQMRMLPQEAINAATINGAFAMGLEQRCGSITVGKRADIILTQPIPSLAYFPYSFGHAPIDKVLIAGEWV